jgi:hypothetical protein
MRSVLLVEPDYINKFPPLGLMKLAAFFREQGASVEFVKGKSLYHRKLRWDAVFVTTLFTWEWKRTVETIRYYSKAIDNPPVFVGGILATLMPKELEEATGATIVTGLLDCEGKLGLPHDGSIELMTPDYSILEDVDYRYPTSDAYFVHSTRGCVNKCEFCAVPTIEPKFVNYRSIGQQIEAIRMSYGEKRDLVLMDNNTVASPKFDRIIDDIVEAGFGAGVRLKGRKRQVDFNQGLDARLLTEAKVKRLSETAIWPLRIAYDDIELHEEYERSVRWAAKYGLRRLSNYVLYNYRDTPEDFYLRLRLNVDLNEELGTHIYSFPMRYSPVNRTDRRYIGEHWTWRYVRGVQCILNATRGLVGTHRDFFLRAFGQSTKEFIELISMPTDYILQRTEHEKSDAPLWRQQYRSLTDLQRAVFMSRVLNSRNPELGSEDVDVEALLSHY